MASTHRIPEEQLLDAACAVFAAEGFSGAGMDAIAARGGTTKPTLYARFGSKERLYAAAVGREYELLRARLFAVYADERDAPFRVRLTRWTSAYFDFARDRPEGFQLISEGERHPSAAALVETTRDRIVERIAQLVAEVAGRECGPGEHLVAAMISGVVTRCAQDAVARGLALGDAAALCESFLATAVRALDFELMDAVS